MGMSELSWSDRQENYADGTYTKKTNVSTADNIMGIDTKRPIVLWSITISPTVRLTTGDISLVDTSATGDAGTQRFVFSVASGATTTLPDGGTHCDFPRGIVFQNGLVVSATTVTAGIALTYKARYNAA